MSARHPSTQVRLARPKALSTAWHQDVPMREEHPLMARWNMCLSRRPRIVATSNIVAAALFVMGCVGFYWPEFYTVSVTMFLGGSVVFLFAALSSALPVSSRPARDPSARHSSRSLK
jgi:hypothetical protein